MYMHYEYLYAGYKATYENIQRRTPQALPALVALKKPAEMQYSDIYHIVFAWTKLLDPLVNKADKSAKQLQDAIADYYGTVVLIFDAHSGRSNFPADLISEEWRRVAQAVDSSLAGFNLALLPKQVSLPQQQDQNLKKTLVYQLQKNQAAGPARVPLQDLLSNTASTTGVKK